MEEDAEEQAGEGEELSEGEDQEELIRRINRQAGKQPAK